MTPYFERDGVVIYHGDARDVLPLLNLSAVALVLADPPYGVGLRNNVGTESPKRKRHDWTVQGDNDQSVGMTVLSEFAKRKTPRIVFASPKKPWPGAWRQHLVWDKGPAVGGGGDPKTCWKTSWEMIQVADTPRLNGPRDGAVLKFWVTQRDYHFHPAQKPVALLQYLVEKASQPGQVVLDPFMGSGSTLIAARNAGRHAIGIETDERYCALAVERLGLL